MRDIELTVNSETGFVTTGKNSAIKQENLQRKIIYKFNGEFVDGTAYLCVKKEDGVTGKIQMTKNGEQYELVIKNGLVSNTRSILINIKIVQAGSENNVPVFVSTVSQIKIEDTIQADMDMIDYYPDWHDSIEGQLAGKVDKEEGKSLIANSEIERLADVHNYDDTEIKEDISNIEAEQTTQNTAIGNLRTTKADKSEIPDVSAFIDKDVNNLTYYTLKTNTGSLIDLEINTSTYVVTLKLKDIDGNVISTDTIDLPLETVVVGGRYDSITKKVILTLENGNTVEFSVADLVAGLQSEITSTNKLASDLVDDTNSGNKFVTPSEKQTWNGKYTKPNGGIPKTDLESAVQTSLGKADTALQEHQSLADYVKNTDYGTYNKAGVLKPSNALRISESSGEVSVAVRTLAQYLTEQNGIFIGKGTLENVLTQYTKSDTVKNIVVTTEEPVNPDNNTLYILAKEE